MKSLLNYELLKWQRLLPTHYRRLTAVTFVVCLCAFLALPSCTSEGYMDELATIELSESGILSFEDHSSSHNVQVQSTAGTWQCYTLNQWITVKNRDGVLEISVTDNLLPKERRGSVIVKSGKSQRQLTIIQAKANPKVETSIDEPKVDQFGGLITIDVITNSEDWRAETEEQWIELTALPSAYKLQLKVQPNRSREPRVGKVLIITGADNRVAREISVEQSGINYFILPYMNFESATRQDIQAFEEKRGGTIEFTHERFFDFTTTSVAFPRVSYTIYEGGAYLHAQLDAASTRILTGPSERQQLVDFLNQSGFTIELGENHFQHNKMSNLEVEIKPYYKNTPHLLFTYTPKQTKEYPTFDELPLGFTRFDLGVEGVKAYEAAHGGQMTFPYSEDEIATSDEMEYETEAGKYGADGRLYFLHKDKEGKISVERTRQFFTQTELACWNYKGYNNLLTNEFKALAKREGFEFVEYNILEQVYVFVSKQRNLTMAVQWFKFYGDPKPVLVVQVNPGSRLVSHSLSVESNQERSRKNR